MRIDKKLNLVIPVNYEKGGKVYVHSTPISRDVFEQYFLVISKTFSALYAHGLSAIAGPRISYLMLKKTAEDLGMWDGPAGVKIGLLNEIFRLTNVAMPGKDGWKSLPLHTVIAKEILDEDTIAEIEGQLVFFTCISTMHKREDIPTFLEPIGLWGSETTSSDCTELVNSLKTLTEEGNTGETAITSSVPS